MQFKSLKKKFKKKYQLGCGKSPFSVLTCALTHQTCNFEFAALFCDLRPPLFKNEKRVKSMVFKKIKGYLMKKYFHQIQEPTAQILSPRELYALEGFIASLCHGLVSWFSCCCSKGEFKSLIYRFWPYMSSFKSHISQFKSHITEFKSHVTQFKSHITQFKSHISHFKSHISQIESHITQFKS